MPPARVTGVVLAAGLGRRMGGPKAELVVGGRRLVDHAVAALDGCDDVLAVVGAGVEVPGVRTVVNPLPQDGLRSSLLVALAALTDGSAASDEDDALAVLLVDCPGIGRAAVDPTVAQWRRSGGVALARYGDGRRGHPVVMTRARWRAAASMAGPDEGARAYLAAHAGDVVEVPVAGDATDLDTPTDLQRWAHRRDAEGHRC